MKLQTKSVWLLTCKEATYFSSLREERLLPFWLSVRLSFHLFSCGPCKRFVNQLNQLAQRLKSPDSYFSENVPIELSQSEKESLQEKIRKAIKK